MIRFLVHRTMQALVVLAVMSFVIYGVMGLMPGDPIDLMIAANPQLTVADGERLKALYGLDLPIWQRYLNWAADALGGDWGYSRIHAVPVLDLLPGRLGNTLLLLGTSLILSLAIAIPAGIQAAVRPGSTVDAAINLACFAGISIPVFWLALLLIMVFAVWLGWLPAGGIATAGSGTAGWSAMADRGRHLILPVLTLTLAGVGAHTRYVRAAMIEQMRQDYVRTARVKGLSPGTVVRRHVLRNALLPLITIVALDIGILFSGALITETMFGYLGMGKLIYDAVMGNDFNLALMGLLLATLATLAGNLLADIGYAALDPRISFSEMRV
jgi:peptide/nickel transport system permease protein